MPGECFCVADVVAVVGISAVDDGVPGIQHTGQLLDHGSGVPTGRNHHPHRPGCGQPLGQLFHRSCAGGTFVGERLDGIRIRIVDDAFVPVANQPPNQVGPHPAQTDHSYLHGASPC